MKFHIAILCLCCLSGSLRAAQYTLTGNTFAERNESLIDCMTGSFNPYTGNVSVKYTAAFYWARIYKGVDAAQAEAKLIELYDKLIVTPPDLNGSDDEFNAHATIHGYFLCKDKLSEALKSKVKQYLHIANDFCCRSTTVNMEMMKYTAGLLAAQEWPDFTDVNNKTATQIVSYVRPRILTYLNQFFHNNCQEMDAPTYLVTNMMYARMLAEFSTDAEVRQRAYVTYQQMIASMTGAWNQGLYISNPPRSKGWSNLATGPNNPSLTTGLAWLYFGNSRNGNILHISDIYTTDNLPAFAFWVAYSRNIVPMKVILDAEKRKTFPYEYTSMIDNQDNFKYYHYTYQSRRYGLATQTEVAYNLSNAPGTYAYKETKRTLLAWQADDIASDHCIFSVCQENPERPTDAVNINKAGYGENPYHRVLGYKGAAIGITNVPTTYLNDNRYMLYVPFSKLGIKLRVISDNWVFCHAGSMMFAFRTIEPFTLPARSPYAIANCDMLMFSDISRHKGAWILQTTEITEDLKGTSLQEEIDKFKAKMLTNTSFDTLRYSSATPQLRYTSLDGDVLDMTYFSPTSAYAGQYKINNVAQPLNDSHLFNYDFVKQAKGANDVYIYPTENETVILNWNDEIPALGIENSVLPDKIYSFLSNGKLLISNIPASGKAKIAFYDYMGRKAKEIDAEIIGNRCSVSVDTLNENTFYIVQVKTPDNKQWNMKLFNL